MAAINKDTRLVMAILFVGAVSGMNIYFYANYGAELPWSALSHAALFALITIGFVMAIKAVFDLVMNDRMELWLLDRKIHMYWEKRKREEQQKSKIVDSMRQMNMGPYTKPYNENEVPSVFLDGIEP